MGGLNRWRLALLTFAAMAGGCGLCVLVGRRRGMWLAFGFAVLCGWVAARFRRGGE